MLTASPNSILQKRDLHVGGLGAAASGALAAVTEPSGEPAVSWRKKASVGARDTEEYVRRNPWTALALAATAGLAAGYMLSRRS